MMMMMMMMMMVMMMVMMMSTTAMMLAVASKMMGNGNGACHDDDIYIYISMIRISMLKTTWQFLQTLLLFELLLTSVFFFARLPFHADAHQQCRTCVRAHV